MAVISFTRRQVLKFIIFLIFATWVVSLAGLIHSTNLCRRKELHPSHHTFNIGGEHDNSARASIINGYTQPFPLSHDGNQGYPFGSQLAYRCGIHFSLEYWTVAFQFFLLVLSYLAVNGPKFFSNKYWLMALIAINVFQYSYYASIFTKLAYNFGGTATHPDKGGQAVRTAMAGSIMVLVLNYIFLWTFNSEWGIEDDLAEEAAKQKAIDEDPLSNARTAAQDSRVEIEKA